MWEDDVNDFRPLAACTRFANFRSEEVNLRGNDECATLNWNYVPPVFVFLSESVYLHAMAEEEDCGRKAIFPKIEAGSALLHLS